MLEAPTSEQIHSVRQEHRLGASDLFLFKKAPDPTGLGAMSGVDDETVEKDNL